MLDIPCRISSPISSESLGNINRTTTTVFHSGNVETINKNTVNRGSQSPVNSQPRTSQTQPPPRPVQQPQTAQPTPPPQAANPQPVKMQIPALLNPIQKGQKVPVSSENPSVLDVRIGWNVNNPACDIDVSAFMLDEREKVIGDSWFVFYSQPDSPDKSVHFSQTSREDRQEMTVSLPNIDPRVKKIVFVLTIYEAAAKRLNFSMISDAYIRILDNSSKKEIVSFKMSEYYPTVLSMMIGEVYNHKGVWKFNAVGNGIAGELDELCKLYGVELQ
ncbi:MAG: TerD family protein [Oscillospiraceae bacterium]|nr:TerD family protein [Oscillospiraceae bacterium]